jgi:hypothetical protein
MVGAAVPGRKEEADYGGEELLTTEELMDAGWRNMVGREGPLLELATCCCSRLVQSCLLEDDLLGDDCHSVAEIN